MKQAIFWTTSNLYVNLYVLMAYWGSASDRVYLYGWKRSMIYGAWSGVVSALAALGFGVDVTVDGWTIGLGWIEVGLLFFVAFAVVLRFGAWAKKIWEFIKGRRSTPLLRSCFKSCSFLKGQPRIKQLARVLRLPSSHLFCMNPTRWDSKVQALVEQKEMSSGDLISFVLYTDARFAIDYNWLTVLEL